VAIIEGFYHSLEQGIIEGDAKPGLQWWGIIESDARPEPSISGDNKEIMMIQQKEGIRLEIRKKEYLPAEKYPYFSLRFYDTYIYYIIPRIY